MLTKWWTRVGAVVLFGVLGLVLVPGCDALGLGGEGGAGGAGGGGELAGVDPQELARANALAYTLTGLVNQTGNASSQDNAATEAAMADNAAVAESSVTDWLATNDASQLSTDYEGYTCTDKLGCPYKGGTCVNKDPGKHLCFIDKCGSATCQNCPGSFKNWAGNLVFKSWCSYLCIEPVAYGKTVAVGVMGVTNWGNVLPGGGPFCFDP